MVKFHKDRFEIVGWNGETDRQGRGKIRVLGLQERNHLLDFHSSKRAAGEPEVGLGGLVLEACTLR